MTNEIRVYVRVRLHVCAYEHSHEQEKDSQAECLITVMPLGVICLDVMSHGKHSYTGR